MTRAVSVGRSFRKGLFSKLTLGALGSVLVTMTLTGCPGTLQGDFPAPTGTGSTAGSSGGTAGAGSAGATGTAGMAGTAGMSGGGNVSLTEGCDITGLITKYKCAQSTCHDAMGTSANFDMTTTGWQNNLVGDNPKGGGNGISSVCTKNGPYIIKGSPTGDGLFIQKIAMMTPPCGAQMPFIMTPAVAADVTCFRQWTTAAAANP